MLQFSHFFAQVCELAQGFVELWHAAAGFEQGCLPGFKSFQRLGRRAQAGAKAGAVEGVAHAFAREAFEIFQFRKAEAEDLAVDLPIHAGQQALQNIGLQRMARVVQQGQAARAGAPCETQQAGSPGIESKAAAGPAAPQRAGQGLAFIAVG